MVTTHNYNTRSKSKQKQNFVKTYHDSDSDSDSDSDFCSESEIQSDEENESEFDINEYRKLLNKLFPSDYSNRHYKKESLYDDETCKKKRKFRHDEESTKHDTTNNFIVQVKQKQYVKKQQSNSKKFSLLLEEKHTIDDISYFKRHMCEESQEKAIIELEKIINHCVVEKPYRLQLLDSDIPTVYKSIALKNINNIQNIEPGTGEFYKLKRWIDAFMQIPFGKYKNLPVTLKDNHLQECGKFMEKSKQCLDDAVYGMNDAKTQIIQLIGQWVSNPSSLGTAIAIKGPMGTGKTTLIKEGVSKAIGRDFAFIPLGGATDSSYLEGHSYTYEGSTWGKIIDSIIQCKSMNPIFFFDELDKVSDTPKGEEIIGILTHLIDTSQNSKFHDKFFSEFDFDLSRCLFIFSYNDESKINPILRDRMYCVETKGYDVGEKNIIANQYLLPKIREQVSFNEGDIVIPDETMKYIITQLTENEKGIRNLKRCLEIIHTKINLYRLLNTDTKLFDKEPQLTVTFPITITKEIIDKLIKKPPVGNWSNMYL